MFKAFFVYLGRKEICEYWAMFLHLQEKQRSEDRGGQTTAYFRGKSTRDDRCAREIVHRRDQNRELYW